MSRSESGGTQSNCCHPPHSHVLHAYVLTCLQDSWPETALKGFEPATFGSVFYMKLEKGNSWRHPRISGPIYFLTSCSSVFKALLSQHRGPGSIPGMSAIMRGNPIMLLPSTTFLCTTCLCSNLLAEFLARNWKELKPLNFGSVFL